MKQELLVHGLTKKRKGNDVNEVFSWPGTCRKGQRNHFIAPIFRSEPGKGDRRVVNSGHLFPKNSSHGQWRYSHPSGYTYPEKKQMHIPKDRQIEKEKDAMMNTQEDQTKNRDLWQFEFQQKASSSHLIDVHHLSQLSINGFLFEAYRFVFLSWFQEWVSL